MSKISTEKYDLVKLERLKHFLETNAEKGKSKFYEIFVDQLKAVDKTNDPSCFDEYQVYLNDDTRMIKVLIYTSTENCPRNDKFIYTLPGGSKEQELNGIEVESKIQSAISTERERLNTEQLRKELHETKEKLEDAEEYIGTLETELETVKAKKNSWKEIQLGNVASVALEEIVKRNPNLTKNVPLLGTLSGLLGTDEEIADTENNSADTAEEHQASFSKKVSDETIDKAVKAKLEFFRQMEDAFSEEELQKVFEIIHTLGEDSSQITTVHNLLIPNP